MLTHLHVKNYAVVEDISLDFSDNFNILTGETGAGKSIIIGAVSIALGGRVTKDMIRSGAEYAYVEMICEPKEEVVALLKEMDIYPDGGQYIISRKITPGKSITKINGETVTTTMLKKVSSLLIDMYGQHEHQSLANAQSQLDIVDRFSRTEEEIEECDKRYAEYVQVKKEWDRLQVSDEERIREISFIEYEMNEIENAGIKEGEEEELEATYIKLSNSEKICEALSQVYMLTGNNGGAGDNISRALMEINGVSAYDDNIREYEKTLIDAESILSDFNREISAFMDDFIFDQELFDQVTNRLDHIRKLFGKYGGSYDSLCEYYDKIKIRYDELVSIAEKKEDVSRRLGEVENDLNISYTALTEKRRSGAAVLCERIIEALSDLNFNDVRFDISFDRKENYDMGGMDKVEFMISTNPGEDIKPLSFVASGGELSRIMLGIKSVLADNDNIYTLIFDEIDTGISGRTAQKVSEKLAKLSRNHQVICITHLAQIASMADAHYMIEKNVTDGRTKTDIRLLTEEESVAELGRILGGVSITDAVVESAREMREMAKQMKLKG